MTKMKIPQNIKIKNIFLPIFYKEYANVFETPNYFFGYI